MCKRTHRIKRSLSTTSAYPLNLSRPLTLPRKCEPCFSSGLALYSVTSLRSHKLDSLSLSLSPFLFFFFIFIFCKNQVHGNPNLIRISCNGVRLSIDSDLLGLLPQQPRRVHPRHPLTCGIPLPRPPMPSPNSAPSPSAGRVVAVQLVYALRPQGFRLT